MLDIEGAIFDLDGTLFDSMPIWDTVAVDYLKSQGIKANDDIYEAIRSMSIQQVCEHFCAVYGLKLGSEEITRGINEMVTDFYFHRAPLKDGVREALERLRARGVRMCVATATDRFLVEAALRRTGILGYFGRIFTSTEVGSGKDEPEIFLRALRYLGTDIGKTVVFEDALYAIVTAKSAGFRVAALYDRSADIHQPRIKELADSWHKSFREWNMDNADV
jgi:HAD superfamily hydrolase (TIGR01509 family)